jgi:hypothetical protein
MGSRLHIPQNPLTARKGGTNYTVAGMAVKRFEQCLPKEMALREMVDRLSEES